MVAWSPEFIHAFLAGLLEGREGGRQRLLFKYILKCVIPSLDSVGI